MIIYHCFLYAIRKKLAKKIISFNYIIQGYKKNSRVAIRQLLEACRFYHQNPGQTLPS